MKTKIKSEIHFWVHFKQLIIAPAGVLLLALTAATGLAQTHTILHTFAGGSNGYAPKASLLLSGGALFGAANGGSFDRGLIFKMNGDATSYTLLKEFTGSDGRGPNGGLVLLGATLYGTTTSGGTSNYGTVFQMNMDGTSHAVLKHFLGSDGSAPNGSLLLAGGTLYGTTYWGGIANNGTVFKLNTDGSGFTVLKHFTSSAVAHPQEGLVLSGATLYGTTPSRVFKLNTDGSGYAVLLQLPGISSAPLALSGTNLYGTSYVYEVGSGTVFKLNTDGSGFAELLKLEPTPRNMPPGMAGAILCGATLYATTIGGDPHEHGWNGTVFRVNNDGSDYKVLQRFDFTNGSNPSGILTLSGTTLYGVTTYGGTSNQFDLGRGVVFSLSLPPPTIVPASQTVETGAAARFRVDDSGFSAPPYQWWLNGTNLNTSGNMLELTNAQPGNCGTYTIVATNDSWNLTSAPAMLNVIQPVERRIVPGLNLTGEVGSSLNVEYSDAVALASNWQPVDTISLASSSQWCFDLSTPLPPQRFYRAWQSGQPSILPSLKLPGMIPAITLTGDVASQVRVDGINAVGPTDAWFPLDTVTVTNSSQLYFDVSVVGQPQRLYRLVPVP